MENASKALIIAGAILLSILIIGLGMFIYGKAAEIIDGTNFDTTKVQLYNSPFTQYDGVISGSSARTLCDSIRTHNTTHASDASQNISVTVGTGTPKTSAPTSVVSVATVNTQKAKIKTGKQYKVSFGYDSKTGYIVDCVITEQQ